MYLLPSFASKQLFQEIISFIGIYLQKDRGTYEKLPDLLYKSGRKR